MLLSNNESKVLRAASSMSDGLVLPRPDNHPIPEEKWASAQKNQDGTLAWQLRRHPDSQIPTHMIALKRMIHWLTSVPSLDGYAGNADEITDYAETREILLKKLESVRYQRLDPVQRIHESKKG